MAIAHFKKDIHSFEDFGEDGKLFVASIQELNKLSEYFPEDKIGVIKSQMNHRNFGMVKFTFDSAIDSWKKP